MGQPNLSREEELPGATGDVENLFFCSSDYKQD